MTCKFSIVLLVVSAAVSSKAVAFPQSLYGTSVDRLLELGIASTDTRVAIPDICKTPPPPAPPFPPNYINPPTRAPLVIGSATTSVTLALAAIILRCISCMRIVRRMYIEDILAVLAWVLSFVMTFFANWSTRIGVGRHWWDIPPEWSSNLGIPAVYIMTIAYTISTMAIKSSILVFFLRIHRVTDVIFSIQCKITHAIVLIVGIVSTCLLIFNCNPVAAMWDYRLLLPKECGGARAKCIDTPQIHMANAGMNLVPNFMILALTLLLLRNLNLVQKLKFQVTIMFGLGGLVLIASIIRIYVIRDARKTQDYPWIGALSAIWSAIELNTTIVVACLPQVKLLLARRFPTSFGSGCTPISNIDYHNSPDMKGDLADPGGIAAVGGKSKILGCALNFLKRHGNRNCPKGSNSGNRSLSLSLSRTAYNHFTRNLASFLFSNGRSSREFDRYDPRNIYRGDLASLGDEEDCFDDDCNSKWREGNQGHRRHHHGSHNHISTGKAGSSSEEISSSSDLSMVNEGTAIMKTMEVRVNVVERKYKENASRSTGGGADGGGGSGSGGDGRRNN